MAFLLVSACGPLSVDARGLDAVHTAPSRVCAGCRAFADGRCTRLATVAKSDASSLRLSASPPARSARSGLGSCCEHSLGRRLRIFLRGQAAPCCRRMMAATCSASGPCRCRWFASRRAAGRRWRVSRPDRRATTGETTVTMTAPPLPGARMARAELEAVMHGRLSLSVCNSRARLRGDLGPGPRGRRSLDHPSQRR